MPGETLSCKDTPELLITKANCKSVPKQRWISIKKLTPVSYRKYQFKLQLAQTAAESTIKADCNLTSYPGQFDLV